MTHPSRGGCPAPWRGESEKALGDNRRIDVSGSGTTAIPNVVATALIVDPTNPSTLYLGTSSGALVCADCGGASPAATWARLGTSLPNAPVDFLSLTGDSVDNIRGVRGVGEKTAAQLLRRYQTVDKLLGMLSSTTEEQM